MRLQDNEMRFCLGLQLIVLYMTAGLMTVDASSRATPRNIEEIFIGRCEEYQNVIRPAIFTDKSRKNCTSLWTKFRNAFAYKGPCDVQVENYNAFVESATHEMDTENKVMYWSGAVYPMVVDYAKHRSDQYVTIREILAAYVIRNIEDWCGQTTAPGMNHNECPAWGHCPLLATTSFWTALSKNFAKQVKGTVHLMLNGSSDQAYRNTSIFAHSELKNLNPARTPTLHVHLAYSLNGPMKEKCGTGSLVTLRQDVEKKGMKFKCTDDDLDILLFQCVTDMTASRCKKAVSGSGSAAVRLAAPGLLALLASILMSFLPSFFANLSRF